MFTRRSQTDIKKSVMKFLDVRKDSSAKIKHLKIILENADLEEAKQLFESHHSVVYFALNDLLEYTETNLKQKSHKQHKDEVEQVFFLLENILILLPDLIKKKWQLYSLTRIMKKLLHPLNSLRIRRDAIKLFLIWFLIVGADSTKEMRLMFSTLVPGINKRAESLVYGSDCLSVALHEEVLPIYPSQKDEKISTEITAVFLECLLDSFVTVISKPEWENKKEMAKNSFFFLLDEFKKWYLPFIFPSFSAESSLYNPVLELPEACYVDGLNLVYSNGKIVECSESQGQNQIVLVKWCVKLFQNIPNFRLSHTFSGTKSNHLDKQEYYSTDRSSLSSILSSHSSFHSSMVDKGLWSFDSNSLFTSKEAVSLTDLNFVKELVCSSKDMISFAQECCRQSFFMHLNFPIAPRKVLALYKDWFMNESQTSPEFLKEQSTQTSSKYVVTTSFPASVCAGMQNFVRYFLCGSCNIFVVDVKEDPLLLNNQVEIAKRVLNLYRHIVMKISIDQQSWEYMLMVLLHIVSTMMSKTIPLRKDATLGGRMASGMFQTLIVTWFRANLNVPVSLDLWDQLLSVLSSLTHWEELINEWGKTVTTLTRILVKHLFGLDLNNLPLNEQRTKRRKGLHQAKMTSSSSGLSQQETISLISVSKKEEVIKHMLAPYPASCLSDVDRPDFNFSEANKILPLFSKRDFKKKIRLARCLSEKDIPHGNDVLLQTTEYFLEYASNKESWEGKISGEVISGLRKSKSEDSLIIMKNELWNDFSCCSSLGLSTNQESTSIKDSPIQLDVLEHVACDDEDGKPVMAGGSIKGWRPDVAFVLWKRLLGALGNPNLVCQPDAHAHIFQILSELCNTMIEIRRNLGISVGKNSTPAPPDVVLPNTLFLPWCFQCVFLPSSYKKGKLAAFQVICKIFFSLQDIPFTKDQLAQFFNVMKFGLSGSDKDITQAIIKWCGPRYISAMLPASSLLLLDFLFAANSILSSDYKDLPRLEAILTVASIVIYVSKVPSLSVLTLQEGRASLTTVTDAKETVINILLRSGKHDSNFETKIIALNALTVFIYSDLVHNQQQTKVPEAVHVILRALESTEIQIAQMACDMLQCIADQTSQLFKLHPELPYAIIKGISESLSRLLHLNFVPRRMEMQRLLMSHMLCLGTWCMNVPLSVLLEKRLNQKQLLILVFEVLNLGIQIPKLLLPNGAPDANKINLLQEDAIALCGRTVTQYLINHLHHFPMSVGASRMSSLVTEQDDLCNLEKEETNSYTLHYPNLQLIALNNSYIASFIELPVVETPGGGITGGLVTAPNQVRVILRSLFGKACWDASILYGTPEQCWRSSQALLPPNFSLDTKSSEKGDPSFIQANVPKKFSHLVKSSPMFHKQSSYMLPKCSNSMKDADNLNDLLCYIGCTSPECLKVHSAPLNEPSCSNIYLPQELEDDLITELANQKNDEIHHLNSMTCDAKFPVQHASSIFMPSSAFHYSRLLFTHLGLSNIEKRNQVNLLQKNDKFIRELKNLDGQKCRETYKVAVIYVASGQEDKHSILSNSVGSPDFEDFVAGLGWEVELESHAGFLGGLQKNGVNGETAPYYATAFCEVIFHVSTRMPGNDDPQSIIHKMRHLGNDEIHIVWSEHYRQYRREILATEFCDVLIVVYPLENNMYHIEISKKKDIPMFGPLFNGIVIDKSILSSLVRATAINASKAQRDLLPFYENFYQERAKALGTIFNKHQNLCTYEEFVASVYSPDNDLEDVIKFPSFVSRTDSMISANSSASLQTTERSIQQSLHSSDLTATKKHSHTTSLTSRSSVSSCASQRS